MNAIRRFFPMILLVCLPAIFLLMMANKPYAAPAPGDVYREYHWQPEGKWQRVTGPEVTEPRARAFLPNKVNAIEIDDLDDAVKVELQIAMLLCHAGTVDKKVCINSGSWIKILESPHIPGESGTGPPDTEYQSMRYPTLPIPLSALHEGKNSFKFSCKGGTALGRWWPQWILYGVTFRVYYSDSKAHPEGKIITPAPGSELSEKAVFRAEASPIEQGASIARVDWIGNYRDFDWLGEGEKRQWQAQPFGGSLRHHIGGTHSAPYEIQWDNRWIPDQDKPFSVVARIMDSSGLCSMTEPVSGLTFERPYLVNMYLPYDIPKSWSTRNHNTHACNVAISNSLKNAVEAKITLCTWNGVGADEILVNDRRVAQQVGKDHDLSYDSIDVPLSALKEGVNRISTTSHTEHHGIEVQWPGPVLFVRYQTP